MARGRRDANAEPDLEPIAPPGWDGVRQQPRALPTRARVVVVAALVIAATLGIDAYAAFRITSVQAAEALVGHLAHAQALERMRAAADQELRVKAMFPEDLDTYGTAAKSLGLEHAGRVAELARRVRVVAGVDGAVRRARTELAKALAGQEDSIREEAERGGTIYDTLDEEFPEAMAAVNAAGRRWGMSGAGGRAAPSPFGSIASVLGDWQRLLDVPTGGVRIVVAGEDLRVIDIDSGEARTLSPTRVDSGQVMGQWALVSDASGEWRVLDLKQDMTTPLDASWVVPGPDGTTVWAVDGDTNTSVEMRLPGTPTSARFDGTLIADTGRHLVAWQGDPEQDESGFGINLYDKATGRLVRTVERSFLIGAGRDALAWSENEPRVHLLMGGIERVVEFEGEQVGRGVVFSPDGRTAAVSTTRDFTSGHLWLVTGDTPPTALPETSGVGTGYYASSWSADGKWLVVNDGRRSSLVNVADKTVHRIRLRMAATEIIGAV